MADEIHLAPGRSYTKLSERERWDAVKQAIGIHGYTKVLQYMVEKQRYQNQRPAGAILQNDILRLLRYVKEEDCPPTYFFSPINMRCVKDNSKTRETSGRFRDMMNEYIDPLGITDQELKQVTGNQTALPIWKRPPRTPNNSGGEQSTRSAIYIDRHPIISTVPVSRSASGELTMVDSLLNRLGISEGNEAEQSQKRKANQSTPPILEKSYPVKIPYTIYREPSLRPENRKEASPPPSVQPLFVMEKSHFTVVNESNYISYTKNIRQFVYSFTFGSDGVWNLKQGDKVWQTQLDALPYIEQSDNILVKAENGPLSLCARTTFPDGALIHTNGKAAVWVDWIHSNENVLQRRMRMARYVKPSESNCLGIKLQKAKADIVTVSYIKELVQMAKSNGYKGVLLSAVDDEFSSTVLHILF